MPGLNKLFSLFKKESQIVNLSFSVPIFTRQNDYQDFGNLLIKNVSSPPQIAMSKVDSGNEDDSDEESKISI